MSTVVPCTANTDPAPVGTAIAFDDVSQITGFGVAVASGRITLPAGAFYLLQCNHAARLSASGGFIDLAFIVDPSGAATQVGKKWQYFRPDAAFPSGAADNGFALVDATGGAVEVEVQVVAQSNEDYVGDAITLTIQRVG